MVCDCDSKTIDYRRAVKITACLIAVIFLATFGFAGSLAAQDSNENDDGNEDDKDPYSHVQLDPRVLNRAVDEIVDLLVDDYLIIGDSDEDYCPIEDPTIGPSLGLSERENLRRTLETYLQEDYKRQLVEDIRAVNEALGLPTMTLIEENTAANIAATDPDYVGYRVREAVGDKVDLDIEEYTPANVPEIDSDELDERVTDAIGGKIDLDEIFGSFEGLPERGLSNILEGLPMAPSPGRHGRDFVEGSREGLPELHDPTDSSLGDQYEDPSGHALSGGSGRGSLPPIGTGSGTSERDAISMSARQLRATIYRQHAEGHANVSDAADAVSAACSVAQKVPNPKVSKGAKVVGWFSDILGAVADFMAGHTEEQADAIEAELEAELEEEIDETEQDEGENDGQENGGQENGGQENGGGDNGEQGDDKDTPAYCPITGPSYPDDDHDEDDVDWWRTPQPDPTGPEDDSGDEDHGEYEIPPGEPDPIGPDYGDEDHGEFEIPPGQEPDPAGPGNGDFDLPGDEGFDFEPLF